MSVQLPPSMVSELRPLIKAPIAPSIEAKLATYIRITTFNLPTTAKVDETVTFSLISSVISQLPSTNPIAAIGIIYVDGPESTIKLTVNGKEFELSKNEGVLIIDGYNPPVGYEIHAGCWSKLTTAGKYKFTAETYYCRISDNTLYLNRDDSQTKEIEVTAPTVPTQPQPTTSFDQITKMLQEQLMPMMMSMMMLMMMMNMLSSMMASMRETFKKE